MITPVSPGLEHPWPLELRLEIMLSMQNLKNSEQTEWYEVDRSGVKRCNYSRKKAAIRKNSSLQVHSAQ
jgi:hypothetical protein